MKINSLQTNIFKRLSGDTNKIHFDKKFASKFFFKEPIVHGLNAALLLISKFLNKKKIKIKYIKINFFNFINVGEKFKYRIYKNKIIAFNEENNKFEINFKTEKIYNEIEKKIISKKIKVFFNFKNNLNNALINDLLYISKLVGKINPGNGSLIQTIKIEKFKQKKFKSKILTKKITKQILEIYYYTENFKVTIIANKLVPFEPNNEETKISKTVLKKIKNKKILIFGPSSDLAKRFFLTKLKSACKLFKYSFRINKENRAIGKSEKNKLKKILFNLYPDYIFYFSSPRIISSTKRTKLLTQQYKLIYIDYLKFLIDLINKNKMKTKIFYPSSVYVKEPQKGPKGLASYIKSKYLAEKICNAKPNKKIVSFYRIPKIQSKSNYNLLGFYEGQKLSVFDKYINQFFKKHFV